MSKESRKAMFKKKNIEQKKWDIFVVPFIFIFNVIPLIVEAKHYENGLTSYAWYSTSGMSYDFFLYWKSRMIIVVGFFLLGLIGYLIFTNKEDVYKKGNAYIFFLTPLFIYGIFATISALLAENTEFSILGSTDQFEGILVLLSYAIIAYYTCWFVRNNNRESMLVTMIVIGTGMVAIIGAFQFLKLDIFRTDFAKSLMLLFVDSSKIKNFNFSFEMGRTYTTLYNPNYVGSFVALLLPFAGVYFVIKKEIYNKIAACVVMLCLLLSLAGSESMTGYIALIASAVFLVVMLIPFMKNHLQSTLIIIGSIVITAAIIGVVKKDAVNYGMNKVFHSSTNDYELKSVEAEQGKELVLHLKDDKKLFVDLQSEGSNANLIFKDENGNILGKSVDDATKDVTLSDEKYKALKFQLMLLSQEDFLYGVKVKVEGHEYRFFKTNNRFYYLSVYNKAVEVREIKAMGFEHNQHFASRRGYIWSRTLPLVLDHVLIGCGPDNFVLEFPNDDFVGMGNNNYEGQMVTKPHNMYLQIAVQTGLLSLLAFLFMYVAYFVTAIKTLWNKEFKTIHYISLACLIGSFGYMVAGIANDSTVAMAYLFFAILGMGVALNIKIANIEKQK